MVSFIIHTSYGDTAVKHIIFLQPGVIVVLGFPFPMSSRIWFTVSGCAFFDCLNDKLSIVVLLSYRLIFASDDLELKIMAQYL